MMFSVIMIFVLIALKIFVDPLQQTFHCVILIEQFFIVLKAERIDFNYYKFYNSQRNSSITSKIDNFCQQFGITFREVSRK